jgi:hypothetical protein
MLNVVNYLARQFGLAAFEVWTFFWAGSEANPLGIEI